MFGRLSSWVLTASPSNLDGGRGPRHRWSAESAGTILKYSQVFSCIDIDSCLPATTPVLQPAKQPEKTGQIPQQAASLEHPDAMTRVLRGHKPSQHKSCWGIRVTRQWLRCSCTLRMVRGRLPSKSAGVGLSTRQGSSRGNSSCARSGKTSTNLFEEMWQPISWGHYDMFSSKTEVAPFPMDCHSLYDF